MKLNYNRELKILLAQSLLLTSVSSFANPTANSMSVSSQCMTAVEGTQIVQGGYLESVRSSCTRNDIATLAAGTSRLYHEVSRVQEQIRIAESDSNKLKDEYLSIVSSSILAQRIGFAGAAIAGGASLAAIATFESPPRDSDFSETRKQKVKDIRNERIQKASAGMSYLALALVAYTAYERFVHAGSAESKLNRYYVKVSDIAALKNILAQEQARVQVIQALNTVLETQQVTK